MCNDTSDDLEEYIKEQKDFLDISLYFEKLVSRLLVIYRNDFTYRSNKLNNIPNLSIEKKYKIDNLLLRIEKIIDGLSSKLDYFIEFNKLKTIEINELLNEYKNRFNVSLESIKLKEN